MPSSSSALPSSWPEARSIFSQALRRSLSGEVCESRRRHVDERLVQCIWFDRLFRQESLQTASGKAVEIIDPGRWNLSAGPDFLGATLKMAGEQIRGDVELHVDSAEWERHAHHVDPAYNDCRLHAFLWAGDDRPYDTLANGRRLERLELTPILEPDIETIRGTIHIEDYPYGRPSNQGLCQRALLNLDTDLLERILVLAGLERLEAKISRLAGQFPGENPDQVLYQALMTAQGHKASKTLYFLLSKRARLDELLELTHAKESDPDARVKAVEVILLHVAGLWDAQEEIAQEGGDSVDCISTEESEPPAAKNEQAAGDSSDSPGDAAQDLACDAAAARAYRSAGREVWRLAAPYLSDRLIPPTRRWFRGVRPANFPARRLAGIANLIVRMSRGREGLARRAVSILRGLADCPPESPREIRDAAARLSLALQVDEPGDFWARRFTLSGKSVARPLALIGPASAKSLLFNVLLPFGIYWARREKDATLERALMDFAARFPPLSPNEVTTFMQHRLFGGDTRAPVLLGAELRRQALFHIFSDCCNNNEKSCSDCLLMTPEEASASRHPGKQIGQGPKPELQSPRPSPR